MRASLLSGNFGVSVLLATTFAGGVHAENFEPTDMCPTIASYDGILSSANQIAQIANFGTDGPVRLNTVALDMPRGSSAAAEIAKIGFAPDQSNLALVQYMNPQIPDISNINETKPFFCLRLRRLMERRGIRIFHLIP